MMTRSALGLVVLSLLLAGPRPASAVRNTPGSILLCAEYAGQAIRLPVRPQDVADYLQRGYTACEGCPAGCTQAAGVFFALDTVTSAQCTPSSLRATGSTGATFAITQSTPTQSGPCIVSNAAGDPVVTVPLSPVQHEACLDQYAPVLDALGFTCNR